MLAKITKALRSADTKGGVNQTIVFALIGQK